VYPFRLLNLSLFRIRTFRAAVSGSFFSRLGMGGIPFLLPLLYQLGLGYTAIQSGLLIMPQALGAMGIKAVLKQVLNALGYRGVLISNTIIVGILMMTFRRDWLRTPGVAHRSSCISLRRFFFPAIHQHEHPCLRRHHRSRNQCASSIASTTQQMSISFGVAIAGLTTAFFLPATSHSQPLEAIQGLHRAFLLLGALTILSTFVFRSLRSGDGDDVSRHKAIHSGE
jgi:hypothetical protein